MKVKHIFLPPSGQVSKLVAAEPPVEERITGLGMTALPIGSDEHDITVAIDVVHVSMAALRRGGLEIVGASPVTVGY